MTWVQDTTIAFQTEVPEEGKKLCPWWLLLLLLPFLIREDKKKKK